MDSPRYFFPLAGELSALQADPATAGDPIKRMFLCDGGEVSANVSILEDTGDAIHIQPLHDELVLILEGECGFRVDRTTKRVRAGDLIFIPKGTVHGPIIDNGRISLLSVFAPRFDRRRKNFAWSREGFAFRPIDVRRASSADVPAITACVCEAYAPYIERIGKRPAPMLEDFGETVRASQVHVALDGDALVGVIVLQETPEGFYIDDVAVRPSHQGTGVGRRLLELAEVEAIRQGHASAYLATHELMTENQALYRRIGYVPYDHRVVGGYPRVFMRKQLGAAR